MRIRGFSLAALLLLGGCVADNESVETDDASGGEGEGEGEVDASVDPEVDAAPEETDATPDAALEPDEGVPVDTPCATACDRLLVCVAERCDHSAGEIADLAGPCAELCAQNPAYATVVNGAETCETVIEFASDGDRDFATRCEEEEENPLPPGPERPCQYKCQGEETCRSGRCVRPDDTCVTSYHCEFDEECLEGTCHPAEFAQCRNDGDCAANQSCRFFSQNPMDPGTCVVECEGSDEPCPLNEVCREDFGNICYFTSCGRAYEACETSAFTGTCYPASEADQNTGYCLEGGTVELEGVCDAQARARTEEDRALRCAGGGFCFGDPDDGLNPDSPMDGRGTCVQMCDPREPVCGEARACIDFTNADNPETPQDERTFIGACLPSDCGLFDEEPACDEGEACKLIGVLNTEGVCREVGPAQPGEACVEQQDCAGTAFCGNDGSVMMEGAQVCVRLCDPSIMDTCPDGFGCFRFEDRWQVGFCAVMPGQ